MSRRRILLVADERPVTDAVVARLRADGFAVDRAADGPTAVETAARTRPDLVLLDATLPGLDGRAIAELSARVRALARRTDRVDQPLPRGHGRRWEFGDLCIDPAQRRVWRAGSAVHLTPTEFELLVQLARHAGTALSRRYLLAEVSGWAEVSGTRAVDSHVKALRRKLGARAIRTVRGVGYALEVPT